MNRRLLFFYLVLAALLAAFAAGCLQPIDGQVASGGGGPASVGTCDNGLPTGFCDADLSQPCPPGSALCYQICGSPSCVVPGADASVPPYVDTPPVVLGNGSTTATPCTEIEAQSMAIRQRACAVCHGPTVVNEFAKFNVLDDNDLIAKSSSLTSTAYRLVTPGDPANSYIYQRVIAASMPPSPTKAAQAVGKSTAATIVYPTAEDQSVLYEWIYNCLGADGGAYSSTYYGGNYGPDGNFTSPPPAEAGSMPETGVVESGVLEDDAGDDASGDSGGGDATVADSGGMDAGVADSGGGGVEGGMDANTNGDPAQYNFEVGAQGWMSTGPPITSVAVSTVYAFLGMHSLAVNFSGAGTQSAYVSTPPIPPGKVVTFHLWIPPASGITSVQAYALQGAAGGYAWTGATVPISQMTADAWNTFAVVVPTNSAPLQQIGLQFNSSPAWVGTCYIDSVGW